MICVASAAGAAASLEAGAAASLEAGAAASLGVVDVDDELQAEASSSSPTAGTIAAACILRIESP
jgi:hypothetical protein